MSITVSSFIPLQFYCEDSWGHSNIIVCLSVVFTGVCLCSCVFPVCLCLSLKTLENKPCCFLESVNPLISVGHCCDPFVGARLYSHTGMGGSVWL